MSRILHGEPSGLERIQFRELDAIPDASESVFEVVSCMPETKTAERPSGPESERGSEKNNGSNPGRQKHGGRSKVQAEASGETKAEPDGGQEPEPDIEGLRAEAYAQGQADARQQMRQDLDSVLQAFSLATKELEGLRSNLVRRQGEDLVRLAMGVAEQVIAAELNLNSDLIISIVGKAMDSAFESDDYRVRVNPEDVGAVQENRPLLLARVNGLRQIHVQGDESIARGGCMVESNKGQVDARLETRMAEIRKQLLEAVNSP